MEKPNRGRAAAPSGSSSRSLSGSDPRRKSSRSRSPSPRFSSRSSSLSRSARSCSRSSPQRRSHAGGLKESSSPRPSEKTSPLRKSSSIPESSVLLVDKLTRNVNEDHLKEVFSEFGKVMNAQVARDRDDNLSKGYGYVEFKLRADAEKAQSYMDGALIDGNKVTASFARLPSHKVPPPPRPASPVRRRSPSPTRQNSSPPRRSPVDGKRSRSPIRRPARSRSRSISPRSSPPRRSPVVGKRSRSPIRRPARSRSRSISRRR